MHGHGIRRGRRRLAALALAIIVSGTVLVFGGEARAGSATITVDARVGTGTLNTQVATHIKYPFVLDHAAGTRPLFRALAAPLVRILATADGCCWPGGPAPMIPAGLVKGDWDFSALDSVASDVTGAGARIVYSISQAPSWMWDCASGTIRDLTFGEFADYMARLISYYNKGAFIAEDGRTITNPAGIANRITYWELWNEPNLPAHACQPNGNPNITAAQYVTMWNATVPKMLAVDPTIKLLGPATDTPDYVTALLAGAVRRPDIASMHGYGGWINAQTDQAFFDGLDVMVNGLRWMRTVTPSPVWITEMNVNSAFVSGADPAHRSESAFGAAWGASAFRRLALAGAGAMFQFEFANGDNANFQLVDPSTGRARLPYWRDYYLARYFPPGSTVLSATSTLDGVETLAVRPPASREVHVLVVNRQVDGPTVVGGSGLPATVKVDVRNVPRSSRVTLRTFDDTTPLTCGPPAVSLPAGSSATVSFTGYGAAILTFVAGSDRDESDANNGSSDDRDENNSDGDRSDGDQSIGQLGRSGPQGDFRPPTAPRGLTATVASSHRIDLSWGASTDRLGVTKYLVERRPVAGCGDFLQIGTATATKYSDTGLRGGSIFDYRVRAMDAANNLSGYSNIASGTTAAAPAGLVAAYGFNEGVGTTTIDDSGRGHTGTISDATWTDAGKYGGALVFNGSTSYVDLGAASDFQITGSMTVSAWILATADPVDDGQIVAKSWGSGWHFKTSPDTGVHTFGVGVSPDDHNLTQRYSVTERVLDTWYHVAGVYNAETLALDIYVNGVLDNGVLRGVVPASQYNAPVSLNIGRHSGGFYFQGTIDEVRLYSRALTQAEIQADMNTPIGAP